MSIADVASANIIWLCVTAVLMTVIIAYSLRSIRKDAHAEVLHAEINDLKRKIGILTLPLQSMDTAYQAMLIKQLTHFHTPVLDALLKKLEPFTLTEDEHNRMVEALQEREKDMGVEINDSERIAARMLPMIVQRVAMQNSAPRGTTPDKYDLMLVAVPREADA